MAKEKDKSLESWIWDAAYSIHGAKDAPKYKDYILPLIFAKQLCENCVTECCPQVRTCVPKTVLYEAELYSEPFTIVRRDPTAGHHIRNINRCL